MVLVHDDDLTCISELSDDTVSGHLYCTLVISIFACLQLLEALEPDALLRHLRSLKPKVHDILLGPGELIVSQPLSFSPRSSIRKIRHQMAPV